MSANLILSMLKDSSPESYMDWNKRDTFDYIILYDWNSNFDNRHQVLDVVYNSLTQVRLNLRIRFRINIFLNININVSFEFCINNLNL